LASKLHTYSEYSYQSVAPEKKQFNHKNNFFSSSNDQLKLVYALNTLAGVNFRRQKILGFDLRHIIK